MAFTSITDADLKGKGNVGKPDTPGVSTAEMQRIMDEIPREVIVPAFNKLVDELNAGGAGSTGATVPGTLPHGTDSTVQGVLNALAKQTDDHLNDAGNPHNVTAAQSGAYTKAETDSQIAAAVTAHESKTDNPHKVTAVQTGAYTIEQTNTQIATAVAAHAGRTDNPHGVTAAQVGAYTKAETEAQIDKKVQAIGGADMVKAVYDPQGKEQDMFKYADDAADNLQLQIDKQQEQIDELKSGASAFDKIALKDQSTGEICYLFADDGGLFYE